MKFTHLKAKLKAYCDNDRNKAVYKSGGDHHGEEGEWNFSCFFRFNCFSGTSNLPLPETPLDYKAAYLAEDSVVSVQPGSLNGGDEKLASVRVLSYIRKIKYVL